MENSISFLLRSGIYALSILGLETCYLCVVGLVSLRSSFVCKISLSCSTDLFKFYRLMNEHRGATC